MSLRNTGRPCFKTTKLTLAINTWVEVVLRIRNQPLYWGLILFPCQAGTTAKKTKTKFKITAFSKSSDSDLIWVEMRLSLIGYWSSHAFTEPETICRSEVSYLNRMKFTSILFCRGIVALKIPCFTMDESRLHSRGPPVWPHVAQGHDKMTRIWLSPSRSFTHVLWCYRSTVMKGGLAGHSTQLVKSLAPAPSLAPCWTAGWHWWSDSCSWLPTWPHPQLPKTKLWGFFSPWLNHLKWADLSLSWAILQLMDSVKDLEEGNLLFSNAFCHPHWQIYSFTDIRAYFSMILRMLKSSWGISLVDWRFLDLWVSAGPQPSSYSRKPHTYSFYQFCSCREPPSSGEM